MMKLAILQMFLLVANSNGYMDFQEKIPNGDHIPHPCKPNFVWKGVGHLKMSGGGERNQFGKHFHDAGNTWTKELCQKDSDGDGRSNGVELGDPDCTWTPGSIPTHTTGTSHPGICDPWDDSECQVKNVWVSCEDDDFKCPGIHEEGVIMKDLRMPLTNVPAKSTAYMCIILDLPANDDYHLIATTPVINESRVMHHIEMFACSDNSEMTGEPFECTMSMQDCPSTIGLWTLGSPGECLYRGAGIRMGTNGFKKVALQVHWTNPEKKEDLWDSSGLTLFYTKHLRKYDSGTMFTGQSYLEIPPLSPKVVQHSTCSPRCTQKIINGSIFITSGLNHMHYLGIAGYVRLTRSDGTVLKLNDDKYYSYDTPIRHQYDPPVEVKPGDSLETVCTYRSMSRKQTAYWGLGTYAEMCYGIFNFFPVEAMPFSACSTSNNLEDCDFFESGCDFAAILNFTNPNTIELHQKVMKACTYMGVCQHGCRKVVEDIKMNNNCFKNSLYDFVYRQYLQKQDEDTVDAFKFVIAMKSCDWESENPIDYKEPVTDYGIHISASFILCISCIAYLVL